MSETESLELAVSMAILAVDLCARDPEKDRPDLYHGFRENFADTLTDHGVMDRFQRHAAIAAFEVQVEMLVPGFEFN